MASQAHSFAATNAVPIAVVGGSIMFCAAVAFGLWLLTRTPHAAAGTKRGMTEGIDFEYIYKDGRISGAHKYGDKEKGDYGYSKSGEIVAEITQNEKGQIARARKLK